MKNSRLAAASLAISLASLSGTAASTQDTPAQPPKTCVGVVVPSVRGIEGSASDIAVGIRDLFTGYLAGPAIQPIAVEARLASQALEEVRQRKCDYLLTAAVTRKRHSGMLGRALGQAGSAAAWQIPSGGSMGTAAARSAVVAGTQMAATLASATKAKDEMVIEYRLAAVAAGPTEHGVVLAKTDSIKAKVDGEDLLTPVVERTAEQIVAAARRK